MLVRCLMLWTVSSVLFRDATLMLTPIRTPRRPTDHFGSTMTAADIIRIATTVATVQCLCNLLFNKIYFSKEDYRRACDALDRANWTLSREQIQIVKPGTAKKIERAKEVQFQAQAKVSSFHVFPNVAISVVFLILIRILGADLGGKVVAVLPFAPFRLLYKLTGRGLDFAPGASASSLESPLITDLRQAASFMAAYVLTNMSIKQYVNKIFGTDPPPGAENAHFDQIKKQYEKKFGLDALEYASLKQE